MTTGPGHLGKMWHHCIFIPKNERRIAAQVDMVAQCCLSEEGQHMTPTGDREEMEHFKNKHTSDLGSLHINYSRNCFQRFLCVCYPLKKIKV